jgi:CRP-like cAMP-binding protein
VTRSVVSCISSEDFRVSLSADARLFREVNQLMSREINSEEDQEIELRSSAVVTRLERLVSEFKESGTSVGPSVARMVSMKQTEIAQMLSITPSHLSRLIRKCSPGVEIATEQ